MFAWWIAAAFGMWLMMTQSSQLGRAIGRTAIAYRRKEEIDYASMADADDGDDGGFE